jgi:putative hemolysin
VRRSHDLLSALLIGNLLVNTAASVVATGLCLAWFGAQGVAIAIPAVTLLLLLFGEITPKLLALGRREQVALAAQWPLRFWLLATRPALWLTGKLVGAMLAILPADRPGSRPLGTAELQTACDLAIEDGTLTETEGRSLARLLQLSELEVQHIMVPRTAVVALRADMTREEVLRVARHGGLQPLSRRGAGGWPSGRHVPPEGPARRRSGLRPAAGRRRSPAPVRAREQGR